MTIEILKELLEVQCQDGIWNQNPYMHGLANGLICAIAVMEDKAPEYLEAPEEWLEEK